MLLAAGRVHHPVDRQSRALVSQLGILILINIAFGFASTGIDNAAHIGGLFAGLWLGFMIPPTRVQTMASLWQKPGEARTSHLATVPTAVVAFSFGVVAVVCAIGWVLAAGARG